MHSVVSPEVRGCVDMLFTAETICLCLAFWGGKSAGAVQQPQKLPDFLRKRNRDE